MAEILELEHLFRVRARDRYQTLVPYQRAEPALRALLVHEIEELSLGDRVRRELDPIGKIEMLGLVLADPRDEEGRSPELPREGFDLRLECGDLHVQDSAGAARFHRGLHLAGHGERLDRKDRHGHNEERPERRRSCAEDPIDSADRASADERDDRPDREITRGGKERFGGDDDHDEPDGRGEWLWQPHEERDQRPCRSYERERGRDREDPRGEAVYRRDVAGAKATPNSEGEQREDRGVDEIGSEVAHASLILSAMDRHPGSRLTVRFAGT